ncbi:DUF2798 domain-containing protein [Vibrio renipiscarius]|uniref:DUF2798 domain-containing protein n=1 Tax=Vibrio renipiscarius TaxID=1461322 RepID=A0A0C2NPN8_9VIBR|nr:DUF2798 domain-containing protein [Vibrio renipiscarius]KII76332.1 hypothetical protein OJ16_16160 [Vibrio renipiscarius]KII78145.1 hypothetical protein PL18_14410 [Vibrio renipiscarius]
MNTQTMRSESTIDENKTPIIQKIVVLLGMITLMGGTLTGVMTYGNVGYSESFWLDWLTSFLTAAVTVIPLGFALTVLLTKGAEKWLPNMAEGPRNALVGIAMAGIMESGMAFTTTLNNIGLENHSAFFTAWLNSLLGALPVALVLMITVSMTIKPKVEQFLKS